MSGDRDAIAAWLAEHGGARRFERGASGDPLALKAFLESRGYQVTATGWQGGKRIKVAGPGRGRPRTFRQDEFIAFIDELRRAEGLEPINRENADV